MSAKTERAARKLGEALNVLVANEICDDYAATVAAMTAIPAGGTPERTIVLDVLRGEAS